ncbi:hypothetical protein CBM2637_A40090 [Cupriavidus taiwanensis]|nr:hypothetical protein CBM2637_A40090 [Cupriavidus taiwanensis]SPA47646.1 protein of unknown function [Cupriavidus taiwanensis]
MHGRAGLPPGKFTGLTRRSKAGRILSVPLCFCGCRGVPAAGLAATPHCQPDTDSLSARAALQ